MEHNRSKNSYIRPPLRVTRQPRGLPSRILKLAIDFLARVTAAFCPAMRVICSAALSRSLMFCSESPTPMFRTIMFSRGTAIGFLYPNLSIIRGTTSWSYRAFNRAGVAMLMLPLRVPPGDPGLLVQMSLALLANPDLLPVFQDRVSHAGGLPAFGADHLEVAHVNRGLPLHQSPLDVLGGIGTGGALHIGHPFDQSSPLVGNHPQHPPGLSPVLPCQNQDLVFLLHEQRGHARSPTGLPGP